MKLTRENIQNSVDQANKTMGLYGIDHTRRIQYALMIEELLLDYMNKDPDADYRLIMRKYKSFISIVLSVRCEPLDLLKQHENVISSLLVSEMDRSPVWRYRWGRNYIFLMPGTILSDFENIRYFNQHFAKDKKIFDRAMLLRYANIGLAILDPILTARIIMAYSGSEYRKIFLFAVLILVQTTLSSLLTYAYNRMIRKFYSSIVKTMRVEVAESVLQIKTEHIVNKGTGVFISRMLDETANVIDGIDSILDGDENLLNIISLLIAFAFVSPKMLLFELIVFVIYNVIQRAKTKVFNRDSRLCTASNEKLFSISGEMVRAHRDIRLLHCEDSFLSKQRRTVEETADLITKKRVHSMNFQLGRTQFISAANFLYMALLAFLMIKEGLAPSVALILFNYNSRFHSCLSVFSNLIESFESLSLSSELINQLFRSRDFAKETFGTKHLEQVNGEIELRNISFSYTDESGHRVSVLKGLNMHIHSGESVAIVGRSGCGKSTVLSLLTRLYDPDRGSILLDGNNIQELDRDSLRGNIGMVNQMPYIFNMSVRENMRVVKEDMTDEEMEKACRLSCIHDDIMAFPDGYDTVIGEGGVTLSGGQKQRLAIARCLVRDYPVIILDEATSALDNITQAQVINAIETVHGKKTIIMVAHRLSTVINCEKLFFLSEGRVQAAGTHQELLESCEEYRRLYDEENAKNPNALLFTPETCAGAQSST